MSDEEFRGSLTFYDEDESELIGHEDKIWTPEADSELQNLYLSSSIDWRNQRVIGKV